MTLAVERDVKQQINLNLQLKKVGKLLENISYAAQVGIAFVAMVTCVNPTHSIISGDRDVILTC